MPAPSTVTVDDMVGLFQRILETDGVGPDSDFFDQGGDSLLATRVLSAVARQYDVELTFIQLIDAASPAALTKLIKNFPG
ncbi:MAG: acyl carrier protein [Actinobacteria bacterium]|nr:acyl carrier protein [Actinomycetota bacterium]